jgi:hemerythrin-like domain-containing protein
METIDNNFVLARSREHKFILETLGELESVLRVSTAEELIPSLKAIIEPFRAQVAKHQGLEEQVIFQAALETMPMQKIVAVTLKLQREHGQITASIEAIQARLDHFNGEDALRRSITNDLNQLILTIKKHSLVEVKELFPAIGTNLRCKQLIDRYAQTLNVDS